MHNSARLAGFFAAHAIWCVSDGGPLIPMVAYDSEPHYDELGAAFFQGVDAHEKGAAIWNQHIDQSI